jgi:hypothetical protein
MQSLNERDDMLIKNTEHICPTARCSPSCHILLMQCIRNSTTNHNLGKEEVRWPLARDIRCEIEIQAPGSDPNPMSLA